MVLSLSISDPNFPSQFGGVSPGSRSWEHGGAAPYSLSPSFMPYRLPPYLQQPNKPFISQGTSSLLFVGHVENKTLK